MKTVSRKKMTIDNNTKQYMKEVRLLHTAVLVIISIAFLVFANTIVSNNRNNLKEVVLVEVQESMQENINNIIIHIETLRKSVEENAVVDIIDLGNRMKTDGVKNVEDILAYLQVCEQNQLGQAIEVVYTAKTGEVYYINKYERTVTSISEANPGIYNSAPVTDKFVIEGQEIILFVQQSEIDLLVKEEMRNYLHSEQYEGGQYVWVNEVLSFSGGENYAVRCIHPNLSQNRPQKLNISKEYH